MSTSLVNYTSSKIQYFSFLTMFIKNQYYMQIAKNTFSCSRLSSFTEIEYFNYACRRSIRIEKYNSNNNNLKKKTNRRLEAMVSGALNVSCSTHGCIIPCQNDFLNYGVNTIRYSHHVMQITLAQVNIK